MDPKKHFLSVICTLNIQDIYIRALFLCFFLSAFISHLSLHVAVFSFLFSFRQYCLDVILPIATYTFNLTTLGISSLQVTTFCLILVF